jgi:ElaB/YqjD/DUF883 family membrane-anchored ribosome-binding protein
MAGNQGTMTHDRAGTGGTAPIRTSQATTGGFGGTGVMEKTQGAVSGAVETAKDWAAGVADTAKDWAGNVADKAQDMASNVAKGAEQAYTTAWDSMSGAEQSLEAFVRRHPLQTMMFAFAAGCLVGMAFCRRD